MWKVTDSNGNLVYIDTLSGAVTIKKGAWEGMESTAKRLLYPLQKELFEKSFISLIQSPEIRNYIQ